MFSREKKIRETNWKRHSNGIKQRINSGLLNLKRVYNGGALNKESDVLHCHWEKSNKIALKYTRKRKGNILSKTPWQGKHLLPIGL